MRQTHITGILRANNVKMEDYAIVVAHAAASVLWDLRKSVESKKPNKILKGNLYSRNTSPEELRELVQNVLEKVEYSTESTLSSELMGSNGVKVLTDEILKLYRVYNDKADSYQLVSDECKGALKIWIRDKMSEVIKTFFKNDDMEEPAPGLDDFFDSVGVTRDFDKAIIAVYMEIIIMKSVWADGEDMNGIRNDLRKKLFFGLDDAIVESVMLCYENMDTYVLFSSIAKNGRTDSLKLQKKIKEQICAIADDLHLDINPNTLSPFEGE